MSVDLPITILPPASRFAAGAAHGEKKQQVLTRLLAFFERFFGLGEG
jgi:type I restriction enzyme, R subunit